MTTRLQVFQPDGRGLVTRQEFVDRHKHELAGLLMDGMFVERSGAMRASWTRDAMRRIDQKLGDIYDQLCEDKQPKPQLRAAK